MNGKKAKQLRRQAAESEGNVSKAAYRRLKKRLRNQNRLADEDLLVQEFLAAKTKLVQMSKIIENKT